MIGVTTRKREIIDAMLKGESRKEIAFRLGISLHTVHLHIRQLFLYFDVTNMAHLIGKMYGLPR